MKNDAQTAPGSKDTDDARKSAESKNTDVDVADQKAPKKTEIIQQSGDSDDAAQEKINSNLTAASADDEKQAPIVSMASESGSFRLPPGTEHTHLERNDFSASQITLFCVGDFVKVVFPNGTAPEGLVMEIIDSEKVVVDFCADGFVKEVYAADCELIVKSDTMEIGDQVQVQPVGQHNFFVARVAQINSDGTYDVVMEGDDPDDVELAVPATNIRKLMSRRAIVIARWKRAAMVVSSINNFQSFVVDPNQYTSSARATKEASVKAANTALYANKSPTHSKSPPATD